MIYCIFTQSQTGIFCFFNTCTETGLTLDKLATRGQPQRDIFWPLSLDSERNSGWNLSHGPSCMLYSSSTSWCCHDATKLTRNMQCLSRQLVQHIVTMPQCLHVPSIYRVAAVARRGTVFYNSEHKLFMDITLHTLYHLPATDQTSPSARCRLLVTYPGGVSGQSLIFHPVCKTRSKKM